MRTLLIYRDYEFYTGGHGKFLDYIGHVQAHPDWQVALYLSPRSRCLADNPFRHAASLLDRWQPTCADAVLVGGMDWEQLEGGMLSPDQPVINLVQHVRHAEPGSVLRCFLPRRAMRVCVSTAVAAAIGATGEVNGPIEVIPAAVDAHALARMGQSMPDREVFVDAIKQPVLGHALATQWRAAGMHESQMDLLNQRIPRGDYLTRMARARIVVTLPHSTEGFYLPGLEAMAMGRALVQYDCVGSQDYMRGGSNALMSEASVASIFNAICRLRIDATLRHRLIAAGQATAKTFDLSSERRHVHDLLDRLDASW